MAIDAGSIYSEVRIKLDKLNGDVQSVKTKLDQIGNKSKEVSNTSSKSLSKGFNIAKLAGVAAFAAITMAIKGAIDIAGTFEQSMANVASVSKSTEAEFQALNNAAMEAGETTRFTASQAADALYSLASAGMSATESVKALDGVLMLAGSTQSDLATTSASMVATLRQYNLDASESTRVSNVFAAAIGNSMANMGKLTSSMTQVGPVASALGVSLEETVGSLEALYDAGYRGEQAGTALKAILGKLAAETDPTTKKLVALGLSFEDIDTSSNSLANVFGTLSEAGLSTGEVMGAFGQEAGGQILALMSAGREGIEDYTEAITDTNAAAEMYAIQNDTLKGSMDRLKSATESAKIKFITGFTPAIRNAIDAVTTFITKLSGSGIVAGTLEGKLDDLKQANKEYNTILDESAGKTDALTQAMVSQSKATRDLALQQLGKAYSESNKQIDDYGSTIEKSTKLIEEYDLELTDLAEGTGHTADELNIKTQAERRSILSQKEMIRVNGKLVTASSVYEGKLWKRKKAAEDLNEATSKLTQAESTEAQFVNTLTQSYIDNELATEQILQAYPELKQAVLDNVDAVKAENKATEDASKFLSQYNDITLDNIDTIRATANAITNESTKRKILAGLLEIENELLGKNTKATEDGTEATEKSTEAQESAKGTLDDLTTRIREINAIEATHADSYDATSQKILAYKGAIQDLISQGFIPASREVQDLKAKVIALGGSFDDEVESIDNATDSTDDLAQANSSLASSLEGYQNKLEDIGKTSLEMIDIEKRRELASHDFTKMAIHDAEDLIIAINEYYDALKDKTKWETFADNAKAVISEIGSALGAMSNLFSVIYDNKIDGIDAAMRAELEAAGLAEESATEKAQTELEDVQDSNKKQLKAIQDRIDAATNAGDIASANKLKNDKDELQSTLDKDEAEKQAIVEKAIIEEKYAKKKAKLEYESAMISWKLNIASATASAAQAILNGFMTKPFLPLGLAMGALATTIGGLQVAAVIASEPPAPKLATGGVILPQAGGVQTTQAENGFPEISFNAGESGMPFMNDFADKIAERINDALGGNRNINIKTTIEVDGKELATVIAKEFNDGRVRLTR